MRAIEAAKEVPELENEESRALNDLKQIQEVSNSTAQVGVHSFVPNKKERATSAKKMPIITLAIIKINRKTMDINFIFIPT